MMLMLFGTATMISVYFYSAYDRYDVILCYYCMVVAICWFIGIDAVKYYRNLQYEPIVNGNDVNMERKKMTLSNNPFDDGLYDEHPHFVDEDSGDYEIGIDDFDFNRKGSSAWNVPPSDRHS